MDVRLRWTSTTPRNQWNHTFNDNIWCMPHGVCHMVYATWRMPHDVYQTHPGLNPEWGTIYYEASITTLGLPELSSLRGRGSTLGTRAAEHKVCNWGKQASSFMVAVLRCVRPQFKWHQLAYAITWLYRRAQRKIVSSTFQWTKLAGK